MEIIVFVNGVDGLLLLLTEDLVGFGFVQFNARNVLVFLVGCRDEKGIHAFLHVLAFDEMKTLVFNFFHAQG